MVQQFLFSSDVSKVFRVIWSSFYWGTTTLLWRGLGLAHSSLVSISFLAPFSTPSQPSWWSSQFSSSLVSPFLLLLLISFHPFFQHVQPIAAAIVCLDLLYNIFISSFDPHSPLVHYHLQDHPHLHQSRLSLPYFSGPWSEQPWHEGITWVTSCQPCFDFFLYICSLPQSRLYMSPFTPRLSFC